MSTPLEAKDDEFVIHADYYHILYGRPHREYLDYMTVDMLHYAFATTGVSKEVAKRIQALGYNVYIFKFTRDTVWRRAIFVSSSGYRYDILKNSMYRFLADEE